METAAKPTAEGRDDAIRAFFELVGTGQIDAVRRILKSAPAMAEVTGPHPFWGGRPQALHVAIETKRRDMFDLLLDAGADVNGRNSEYEYWSPLMLALSEGETGMRDELLRRGARVGLCEALLMADDARVDELLAPGISALPGYAPNGGSILSLARTTHAIDRLLELGVPTGIKDRWGSTPIDAMSRLGGKGLPLVRHMIARGVEASAVEYARLGDRETLGRLISADTALGRNEALMMAAVEFRHYDLVRWLLSQGANANARSATQSRQTALHSAAWNGDLDMVKLLLEAGADPNARDEQYNGTAQGWAEVAVDVENNPACRTVAECLREVTGS